MAEDVDYLPRGGMAYEVARLGIANRLLRDALRRTVEPVTLPVLRRLEAVLRRDRKDTEAVRAGFRRG